MKKTYKNEKVPQAKWLSALLLGLLPVLLCSCGTKEPNAPPKNNALVQSQDLLAEKFNSAVAALEEAGNYRMTGSVTSVAEVMPNGVQTVNVSSTQCVYDNGQMQTTVVSNLDPHSTYFDGERYYFFIGDGSTDLRYFTTSNDYNDYSALDYLLKIDAEIISNMSWTDRADGGINLAFEIPFAIYDSPAIRGWLGYIVDESHGFNQMSITAVIDRNGYFTEFTISFINDTDFDESTIHQEIVVAMILGDYSNAILTRPTDLEKYEDWSETADPDELDWGEIVSPEDME